MKRLILVLMMLAFAVPSFSITQEEIEQAHQVLASMQENISIANECVHLVISGQMGYITLTPEQIQLLKNKYLEAKQELQNLYQQLP